MVLLNMVVMGAIMNEAYRKFFIDNSTAYISFLGRRVSLLCRIFILRRLAMGRQRGATLFCSGIYHADLSTGAPKIMDQQPTCKKDLSALVALVGGVGRICWR